MGDHRSSRVERRKLLDGEIDLQVLPPDMWATIAGLGIAIGSGFVGTVGLITAWDVPGLPHIYTGLLVLSLVVTLLMLPLIWNKLPERFKSYLRPSPHVYASPPTLNPPAWSLPATRVCRLLHVLIEVGLHKEVAAKRLRHYGSNEWETNPLPPFGDFVVANIYTPSRALLFSLIVFFTALANPPEALLASSLLLLLLYLSLYAEWSGRSRLSASRLSAPRHALVLRDGAACLVLRSTLVPGDIVLLRAGMEVPADLRLLHSTLLQIDESPVSSQWDTPPTSKQASALLPPVPLRPPSSPPLHSTPRSSPARKSPLKSPPPASPPASTPSCGYHNMALAGSHVTAGAGSGVVVATGPHTTIGKLQAASQLQRSSTSAMPDVSPVLLLLRRTARQLVPAAVIIAMVVAAMGAVRSTPWQEVLLTSVALLSALLPSSLTALTYSSLGAICRRVASHHLFFRHMGAIESLAAVDSVVISPESTLTEGRSELSQLLLSSGGTVMVADLAEANQGLPSVGPLAEEGGMTALGRLLEAWLFMSDTASDLLPLQQVKRESAGPVGGRNVNNAGASERAASGSTGERKTGRRRGEIEEEVEEDPEGSSSAWGYVPEMSLDSREEENEERMREDAEFLKRIAEEAKEAGAGSRTAVDIAVTIQAAEGQSEALLSGGGGRAGRRSDALSDSVKDGEETNESEEADGAMESRGGSLNAMDRALLEGLGVSSAVAGDAPLAGTSSSVVTTTSSRGLGQLKPLPDLLRKLRASKACAELLVDDVARQGGMRGGVRVWGGVASEAVRELPAAIGAPRAKAVHAKLLAMGKKSALHNGAPSSPSPSDLQEDDSIADDVAGGDDLAEGERRAQRKERRLFVCGPAEVLLERCSHAVIGGKIVALKDAREGLMASVNKLAEQGLSMQAYASGQLAHCSEDVSSLTTSELVTAIEQCTFVGCIAVRDGLRQGVQHSVMECRRAGVRVIVVTEEHLSTAQAWTREAAVGYPHQARDTEIEQVPGISCLDRPPSHTAGDELQHLLASCPCFARASPSDRLFLVEALHTHGTGCVAACGTVLSDAPVVAAADVGIAVGPAVDAVHDVSSVVSLSPSFSSIAHAVRFARCGTFNVRKALAFGFGARLGLALVVLLGVIVDSYPLLSVHILVTLLLIDFLTLFAFPSELPDSDAMADPPRPRTSPFFSLSLLLAVALAAAAVTAPTLLTFTYAAVFFPPANITTVTFSAWLLSVLLVALNMRTAAQPLLSKGLLSNLYFCAAAVVTLLLVFLPSVLPALCSAVHCEHLQAYEWALVFLIAVCGTAWIEVVKLLVAFCERRAPVNVIGVEGGAARQQYAREDMAGEDATTASLAMTSARGEVEMA